MNKEYYRVKKYYLKCTIYGQAEYEYTILATNSDNALSMINRQTEWDEIQLHRTSDVIAWAQYTARDITNDPDLNFSLHYHAKPVTEFKS